MAGKPKKLKTKREKIPLSAAEIKRLGFEYENIVQADETLNYKKSLAQMVDEDEKLAAAWQRGQFLRNLQALAGIVSTVSEAAHKLGLQSGEALREMLDTDRDAAEIWSQTRLNTIIAAREALLTAAKEGNQAAIRAVENYLREEKQSAGGAQFDLARLRQVELTELLSVTRPTLNEWESKYHLPRNTDKTYSLKDVLRWYVEYLKLRSDSGSKLSADKLRDLKATEKELDLAERRGMLLDRNDVIAGLVARYQNIVGAFRYKKRELAVMLHSQTIDGIDDILGRFFEDLQREQLNIPEFLKLSPAANEKLKECLELCSDNSGAENNEK